jgi:hypothetical protein
MEGEMNEKQLLYSLKELLKILIEDFGREFEDGKVVIEIDTAILGQIKASIKICEEELSRKRFAEAIFSDKHHPLS